jgi:hypothetical protein
MYGKLATVSVLHNKDILKNYIGYICMCLRRARYVVTLGDTKEMGRYNCDGI